MVLSLEKENLFGISSSKKQFTILIDNFIVTIFSSIWYHVYPIDFKQQV